MIKTTAWSALYTVLNIRYAALILPTGIVAYLLQFYWLAWVAAGLLVAAAGAELALSVANGVRAAQQVKAVEEYAKEQERRMAQGLADLNDYANDWTRRGSEDPAPEGEGPDEGQAPVPAKG